MSASARRFAVCAGALAAVVACVGPAGAVEPEPATINDWVNEVAKRPPPTQIVRDTYKRAQTINLPFSSDFRAAIREVLEWRVAHMALGLAKGLDQDLPADVSVDDVRRLWRVSILQDVRSASSKYFRDEAAVVLGPILAAVTLGYNDANGRSENAVRANAVRLLADLPGSDASKVNALLRLLRTKGVDQGSLFVVIRELGRQRIAAAVPTLAGVLSDPNPVLQAAAARALGAIGDENALDPLLDLLNRTGDTVAAPPEAAQEALLAAIAGIRMVVAANTFDDQGGTLARVEAALMRCVLSDPDRSVVVEAAEGIRQIAGYPHRLDVRMPEDQLQRAIEVMRVWWLQRKRAKEHYREFFSLEPIPD